VSDAARRALKLLAASEGVLATTPSPSRESVRSAHRFLDESLTELGVEARLPRATVREKARRVRAALRAERRQRLAGWLRARASWRVLLALACVVAALSAAVWYRAASNLLLGATPVLSSEWARCEPERGLCGGFSTRILFHTHEQPEPWVQYDLGRVRRVRALVVRNRSDALQDRAVPLVASVSTDGVHFREVARQGYWFQTWRAAFSPVDARYFRLTVARTSILHLERVELR